MDPKISIIVPVYKVENYLRKCIESILAQTFSDFELILIDDGSPDNCGKICDEYAQQDNRVIVIHKKNGGLSSARNAGIEIAKGNYLGFVDSDDYIHEKMYEILFENAQLYSSDVVVCNFLKVNEEQLFDTKQFINEPQLKHYTNIETLNQLFSNEPGTYITGAGNSVKWIVAWNKLYKRDLYKTISFDDGRICEDEFIIHKIFFKSKKVTYVSNELYFYIQRPESIINSQYSIKRFDKVYALKERADFFKSEKLYKLHEKAIKSYLDAFFWNYYKAKYDFKNINMDLKLLKSTIDKSLIDILNNPLISWKQKLAIVIFSINPFLYELYKNRKMYF